MLHEFLSFTKGRKPHRSPAYIETALVRRLGQDLELEARITCSVTNVTVQGSQLQVNGEATRLIMYGTYGMIEPGFSHKQFFDTVKQYNINAVRLWINFHWAKDLSPFARPTGAAYDLKSWSTTYFARLKDFVAEADRRGIVVQVCLFDGVMLENTSANRWGWSPYRDNRNLAATAFIQDGNRFTEFFATADNPKTTTVAENRVWTTVNRPLIRKVVSELAGFGNIIWEVMNEPTMIDGYTSASAQQAITAFHAQVVAELKSATGSAASKVISVNAGASGTLYTWANQSPDVHILSVHMSGNDASQATLLANATKPIIISNDGHESCKTLEQGGNYGPKTRAQLTEDIVRTAFEVEDPSRFGSRHFEFLDVGLYGSTWRSGTSTTAPNYNAQAHLVDTSVLQSLSLFTAKSFRGNFLGNGRVDTAVWYSKKGSNEIGMWYIRDSLTGQVTKYQWGLPGDVPVPGNYFGNDRLELAVWRPSDGTWYIYNLSTGEGIQRQWGLPGDIPLPGNYLGDSHSEIVVWRPSTAMWYVWDLVTNQQSAFQWGLVGDVPVPGNYLGDSRFDLAVWRPGNGTWYVWNIASGQRQEIQWGLPGDVPVPKDENGDGVLEYIIWRPNEQRYYIRG